MGTSSVVPGARTIESRSPTPRECGWSVSFDREMEGVVAEQALVLTVEEAAELLGISRGLAYELVRRRQLPAIRLGRRLVVPRRRLLALIEGAELETSVQ